MFTNDDKQSCTIQIFAKRFFKWGEDPWFRIRKDSNRLDMFVRVKRSSLIWYKENQAAN